MLKDTIKLPQQVAGKDLKGKSIIEITELWEHYRVVKFEDGTYCMINGYIMPAGFPFNVESNCTSLRDLGFITPEQYAQIKREKEEREEKDSRQRDLSNLSEYIEEYPKEAAELLQKIAAGGNFRMPE